MKAAQLLQAWQQDVAKLCTMKHGDNCTELSLPFSTLTSKFIRVFVIELADEWLITDMGDLAQGTYGFEGHKLNPAYDLAARIMGTEVHPTMRAVGGELFVSIKSAELLTSAIFDFAQFIQLCVNTTSLMTSRLAPYVHLSTVAHYAETAALRSVQANQ